MVNFTHQDSISMSKTKCPENVLLSVKYPDWFTSVRFRGGALAVAVGLLGCQPDNGRQEGRSVPKHSTVGVWKLTRPEIQTQDEVFHWWDGHQPMIRGLDNGNNSDRKLGLEWKAASSQSFVGCATEHDLQGGDNSWTRVYQHTPGSRGLWVSSSPTAYFCHQRMALSLGSTSLGCNPIESEPAAPARAG